MTTPEPAAEPAALPCYRSILLALDSSDHANRGIDEAIGLARLQDSRLTASHVYAAKLHDLRFRQMEGGLPEQFRQEQELERQREVHDSLISKGLNIISDAYLDQAESRAHEQGIGLQRLILEGKNYRQLANAANSGDFDLLVLGALGLGSVSGSRLGSVTRRLSRLCQIDQLIIKQPTRPLDEGPILVAVDGSAKSYGGLLTGLALGKLWQVPVKVISAFDPYYHYVAFNRIAGVLSEQAGEVFRFKEQEQLHEEIIDSGLAKIYQGHLSVAESIAQDHGLAIETLLVDGKPHAAISKKIAELNPSLLILGTTGIHADTGLDIGSNSEQLLEDAPCAVLLSQREHQPQVDRLAAVSTSWSQEAEARMERVPEFVKPMARMAILRYAQEQGHTVITERIVEQATAELMPRHAEQNMAQLVEAHEQRQTALEPLSWSTPAETLLQTIDDPSLRDNLAKRAEKKARSEQADEILERHLQAFIDPEPAALRWQAAALARLMRVPEGFMRDGAKRRIEAYALAQGVTDIDLETAEAGMAQAREAMSQAQSEGATGCPHMQKDPDTQQTAAPTDAWNAQARAQLERIPADYRKLVIQAVETLAAQSGVETIDQSFLEQIMSTFQSGSAEIHTELPWSESAQARIERAPTTVRGMLIKEIEGWCRRHGLDRVSDAEVDQISRQWGQANRFHLDPDDPRNR